MYTREAQKFRKMTIFEDKFTVEWEPGVTVVVDE